MPPTWYSTPARLATLEAEAVRWVGTPWRLNSAICGPNGAVSCTRLAAALYCGSGFLPVFTLPPDNIRSLILGLSRNLRDFFPAEIAARFTPLTSPDLSSVIPGDLVLFAEAGSALHLGVMLEQGRFIHSMRGVGTTIAMLADPTFAPSLVEALRPNPA